MVFFQDTHRPGIPVSAASFVFTALIAVTLGDEETLSVSTRANLAPVQHHGQIREKSPLIRRQVGDSRDDQTMTKKHTVAFEKQSSVCIESDCAYVGTTTAKKTTNDANACQTECAAASNCDVFNFYPNKDDHNCKFFSNSDSPTKIQTDVSSPQCGLATCPSTATAATAATATTTTTDVPTVNADGTVNEVAGVPGPAPVPPYSTECKWRRTGDCNQNRLQPMREVNQTLECNEDVPVTHAGFCDCDGDMLQDPYEPNYNCATNPGTCNHACQAMLTESVCAFEGGQCHCTGAVFYGRRYVGVGAQRREASLAELKGLPFVCVEEGAASDLCNCTGQVYYTTKYKDGNEGPQTTFADLQEEANPKVRTSTSSVSCDQAEFYPGGNNPNPEADHVCFCEPYVYREQLHVAGGPVKCEAATFGSDPIPDEEKYCYCKGKMNVPPR